MADSPKVPLTNKPGVSNWVEKYHALPKGSWIRRAAEHIKAKGRPESLAIPFAVNAAEKLCSTGDTNLPGLQQANAKSRAEACAALVIWKRAAARAKASKDLSVVQDVEAIELAVAYIGNRDGDKPHLPKGAVHAYLDLAFDESKHPRGALGRFVSLLEALRPGRKVTLGGVTVAKHPRGFSVRAKGRRSNHPDAGQAAIAAIRNMDLPNRIGRKGVSDFARRA